MTNDDRLFGYRLQLFELAERTTVTEACRTFGVHRSTFYRWKRRLERHGPETLRPVRAAPPEDAEREGAFSRARCCGVGCCSRPGGVRCA